MAIRRGEQWGSEGPLPANAPTLGADNELAQAVAEGATHVRLSGGDLAKTLGVSAASLERQAQMQLPVDTLLVRLDGDVERRAVAHVRVGRSARSSTFVMNAAFYRDWNLAPRSHPGDGRVDVIKFAMSASEWLKARSRLRTGAHLPHPQIATSSHRKWSIECARSERIWLDDKPVARATVVEVTVDPGSVIVGV